MSKHPLHERVDEMLLESGGLYTFDNIVEAIRRGDMQSFALESSWAVTQICEFPQKRVLDVLFVVGTLDDEDILHAEVEGFARLHNIEMLHTWGRKGFKSRAESHGWKQQNMVLYTKDLSDGPEDPQ